MDSKRAIARASEFLISKRVRFEGPITVMRIDSANIEVVFTALGALDPNLVVDPPDIKVRINTETEKVELIPDMWSTVGWASTIKPNIGDGVDAVVGQTMKLFTQLTAQIGCEYRPRGDTIEGLKWMRGFHYGKNTRPASGLPIEQ
jgi:hypothetical protein